MKNLNRLRLQPDKRLTFLQGFLKYPHLVGSVIPSSRFLERRLIECSGIESARLVVELGPGTGGTTRAMLRVLPRDSKLLAIEINPQFASLLRSDSNPQLLVYSGSAEYISDALVQNGLTQPDVIVSGIPFSTMPFALGKRIVSAVWDCLKPGGCFVAYQFRDRVAMLGRELLGDPQIEAEFLNVPPMRLYRWDKTDKTKGRVSKPKDKRPGNDVKIAKGKNGKKHHLGSVGAVSGYGR